MNKHYQLAVLGSGSGGREAALVAAQNGLRVLLIEKETLGGTCLHRGFYCLRALRACIDSVKDKSRRTSGSFDAAESQSILKEWAVTRERVTARLTQALDRQMERAGVEIQFGRASLIDPSTISVAGNQGGLERIQSDYIIVATGSRPNFAVIGAGSRLVNSDELLRRRDVPRHLLVIGGGYIGCEFASIYRSIGSSVTLVERCERLLPDWDEAIGSFVASALRSAGIELHLGCDLDVLRHLGKSKEATFILDDGTRLNPELVLVATGRKPNVEDLGLESAQIVANPFIAVDEQTRSSCAHIFAVGDVNGVSLLDSAAVAQARVAVDAILGKDTRFSARWIPKCIHTDPPAASIGWNEDEAGKAGLETIAHCGTFPLLAADASAVAPSTETMLKILLRSGSRQILGVHVSGHQAVEIVNFVSAAIRFDLTLEELLQVPLVYPSTAEVIQECAKGLRTSDVVLPPI